MILIIVFCLIEVRTTINSDFQNIFYLYNRFRTHKLKIKATFPPTTTWYSSSVWRTEICFVPLLPSIFRGILKEPPTAGRSVDCNQGNKPLDWDIKFKKARVDMIVTFLQLKIMSIRCTHPWVSDCHWFLSLAEMMTEKVSLPSWNHQPSWKKGHGLQIKVSSCWFIRFT